MRQMKQICLNQWCCATNKNEAILLPIQKMLKQKKKKKKFFLRNNVLKYITQAKVQHKQITP